MMRPALGELLRYFIRRGTTGFGGMAWLQGAFYGVGAAVIAIIARSAAQLALVARGRTNDTGQSAASFAFVFPASTTLTSVIDGKWFLTGLASVASLAIVPFLHGGVVLQHHWLSEQQFLDAVAVALITPGPVVITVAFIGYLVAGPLGATAAAAGVFAPVYFITLLLAPHYERYKSNPRVRDFIAGVTAAATKRDCRRDNRAWSLGNRRLDHNRDCIADTVAAENELHLLQRLKVTPGSNRHLHWLIGRIVRHDHPWTPSKSATISPVSAFDSPRL